MKPLRLSNVLTGVLGAWEHPPARRPQTFFQHVPAGSGEREASSSSVTLSLLNGQLSSLQVDIGLLEATKLLRPATLVEHERCEVVKVVETASLCRPLVRFS
jgi:hypothetical protein